MDGIKILLSPISEPHIEGSVPIKADCGHQCWIGPVSLNTVLNPFTKTTTVCNRCADPKELREAIAKHGIRALPGAREELQQAVGREEADAIFEQFNVREDLP